MKLFNKIIAVICLGAALCSCENFFEKTPDTMLTDEQAYKDRTNVYAAFIGTLATFQTAIDHVIIMSELRGDLVQPTDQAPDIYWDVFRYQEKQDNPLIDPAPLYKMVMNANDFLRNAVAYNKKYPGVIPISTYKQMIGGVICTRAWAYLQIGKLYGKAVYYDYSMTSEIDLSKLPEMNLERLVRELIYFMNTGVDGVTCMQAVNIDTMFDLGALPQWRRMTVQPDVLLCELYLWNKEYAEAAKQAIRIITNKSISRPDGTTNTLTCSYQFGTPGLGGLKNWQTIFSENGTSAAHMSEALTVVYYDYTSNQTNKLQYLFSPTSPNVYYMKPTQALKDKYEVTADYEVKENNKKVIRKDVRKEGTYGVELGVDVIKKYHLGNLPPFRHDKQIYVYRAAEVFLMLGEALSYLGNLDAADAIYNEGMAPYYSTGRNYIYPFDAPIYAVERAKESRGVRGRLALPPLLSTNTRFNKADAPFEDAAPSPAYTARRKAIIDSLIGEETARELAVEGKHWFTLLRMARNSQNPDILAGVISQKFKTSADDIDNPEVESYRTFLKDPDNWFIKYDFKNKK